MEESVEPEETRAKDPAAVELGRRGGLKSAAGRMARMTAKERSAVARKAGRASAAAWRRKNGEARKSLKAQADIETVDN